MTLIQRDPSQRPERIYRAQHAGMFNRLRDAERMKELDAERWIARWEREAEAYATLFVLPDVRDTMNPSWRRHGRYRAGSSSFHRARAGGDTNHALRLTRDLDR